MSTAPLRQGDPATSQGDGVDVSDVGTARGADGPVAAFLAGGDFSKAPHGLPRGIGVDQVLALQRSAGNGAVARLLARQAAEDGEGEGQEAAWPMTEAPPPLASMSASEPAEPEIEEPEPPEVKLPGGPDEPQMIDAAIAQQPDLAETLEPPDPMPVLARTPQGVTPGRGGRTLQRDFLDDVGSALGGARKKIGGAAEAVADTAVGVAGTVADTASDIGGWIGDKAGGAFDALKGKVGEAFAGVTDAFAAIRDAIVAMDPAALSAAWSALTGLLDSAWSSVERAGSWFTGMLGDVASPIRIPGLSRTPAGADAGGVLARQAGGGVLDSITGPFTGMADRLLGNAFGFIKKIRSFDMAGVITKLEKYVPVLTQIKEAAKDPDAAMKPYVDEIATKLEAETPAKAAEVVREKGAAAGGGPAAEAPAPATGALSVARQHDDEDERTTMDFEDVCEGVVIVTKEKFKDLHFWPLVKEAILTLLWPWETVGKEVLAIGTDWSTAAGDFYMPRSPLSDLGGCLHDCWTNLLHVAQFPLILWRRLSNIGLALMFYITLLLTGLGFIGGGAIGGVLGAIAGALAGLGIGAVPGGAGGAGVGGATGAGIGFGVALSIGEFLTYSFAAAEGAALVKAFGELWTGRQTEEEQERDFNQAGESAIALGILAILVAALWLGGKIASLAGPFLRRLVPAGLRGPLAKFLEGLRRTRKKPKSKAKDDEKPPEDEKGPMAAEKAPMRARLRKLTESLARSRRRLGENGGEPTVEQRLTEADQRVQELSERLDSATSKEDLSSLKRDLKDMETVARDLEVSVGKVPLRTRVRQLRERLAEMKERLDEIQSPDKDLKKKVAELQARIEKARAAVEEARADVDSATSERHLADVEKRLADATAEVDAIAQEQPLKGRLLASELGITPEAEAAMRNLERVRENPLGDVNQNPKKNHYKAARAEARNEPVGHWKDGTPYDHIKDLQQARDELAGIRDALDKELANPRDAITEKGIDQLAAKRALANDLLKRLDDFLNEIGWPARRPHRWVKRDGRWVGEGDPPAVRARLNERIGQIEGDANALRKDIGRVSDRPTAERLLADRQRLLDDSAALRERANAAPDEPSIQALEPEVQVLRDRLHALEEAVHQARTGAAVP